MNKYDYKNLTPFKWFVLENFPFIEADFDALTNWQLFCKLGKEINIIIDSQNTVGTQMENVTNAFIELKNFVDNYFENLDVQEEINNKLDDMVEAGTLQEIITNYLNSKAIFCFNNVEEMKNSTNLIEGSYAKTLGYYNKNDEGSTLYYIRKIINDDVVNNMNIVSLENDNTLIAEIVLENNNLNLASFGIQENTDISNKLEFALEFCKNNNINLILPNGIFEVSKTFTIPDSIKIEGTGNSFNNETTNNRTILKKTNNLDLFMLGMYSDVSRFDVDGNNTQGACFLSNGRCYLHDISIFNFDKGIKCSTINSNLGRYERIKFLTGDIGIYWVNENSSNGQSCSFNDIDILSTRIGLDIYQPRK